MTRAAGSAVLVFALAFILMLYLLIEGRQTYHWLLAFVPRSRRSKVAQTAVESQRVIFGYVAGNVATSVFATVFALISLTLLHVPAALLLALLAGLGDFVPVVGFIPPRCPPSSLRSRCPRRWRPSSACCTWPITRSRTT